MNGHWVNSVKSHLNKGIKLRNKAIAEHNAIVDSGEIANYRWRFRGKFLCWTNLIRTRRCS